jgi:hypothetical protein
MGSLGAKKTEVKIIRTFAINGIGRKSANIFLECMDTLVLQYIKGTVYRLEMPRCDIYQKLLVHTC